MESYNIEFKEVMSIYNIYKYFPGFPDIDLLTDISGRHYERSECRYFTLLFTVDEYLEEIDLKIKFKQEYDFNSKNIKLIRKLLEITYPDLCLVVSTYSKNAPRIVGFSEKKGQQNKMVILVNIFRSFYWIASIKNQGILKYKDGKYQKCTDDDLKNIDDSSGNYLTSKEKSLIESLLGEESIESKSQIINVIDSILNIKKGTSLVVMDPKLYSDEVLRFSQNDVMQGISIKNINIFSDKDMRDYVIKNCALIDGGLLMDLDGNCSIIGCIFDGRISEGFAGDMNRGARYNSVKKYIHNNIGKCCAFVFSDDGYLDFLGQKTMHIRE